MHIERRGTLFYWVQWGTDGKGVRFVNVFPSGDGNTKDGRKVKRWVEDMFDELTDAYQKATLGLPYDMVEWAQ